MEFYNNESEVFKSLQSESESVQAKSDLLAYKVHLLNSLAFSKYIKDKPFPEYPILSYYFSYEFVSTLYTLGKLALYGGVDIFSKFAYLFLAYGSFSTQF